MSLAGTAWLRGPSCPLSSPIPSSSGRTRARPDGVWARASGSMGGGRRGGHRHGAEHGTSPSPGASMDCRSSEREAHKMGATRSREGIEAKLSRYRESLRADDDDDGGAGADGSLVLGLESLAEGLYAEPELPEQDFDLADLLGPSPKAPSAPPPRRNEGVPRRPRRLRSNAASSSTVDKEGRRRARGRGRRQAVGTAGEGAGGWTDSYHGDVIGISDCRPRRGRPTAQVENSAFSAYMEEMSACELLSKEEEVRLSGWLQQALEIRRVQEALEMSLDRPPTYAEIAADAGYADGDEMAMVWERGLRAKRQLMLANLKLVVSIAKKYLGRGTGLTLHDLCQEGALGLGTGTEKFDPSRGFRFSTYAYNWIRSSVQSAVARDGHPVSTPRRVYEQLGKLNKARRAHASAHGATSSPSVAELSALSGLTPNVVERLLAQQKSFLSLEGINKGGGRDGGDDSAWGRYEDVFEGEGEGAVTDTVDAGLAHEAIHGVISAKLTPREAAVLRMRYGLDGCSAASVGDVGRRLGIAANTVREVESLGLSALMSDDEILAQMEAYLYLYT